VIGRKPRSRRQSDFETAVGSKYEPPNALVDVVDVGKGAVAEKADEKTPKWDPSSWGIT